MTARLTAPTLALMRELIDRIGLANAIVGVIAAALCLLIIGAGFDFDASEMIEIFVTFAAVGAALGAFLLAAHVVGVLLDAIEQKPTE